MGLSAVIDDYTLIETAVEPIKRTVEKRGISCAVVTRRHRGVVHTIIPHEEHPYVIGAKHALFCVVSGRRIPAEISLGIVSIISNLSEPGG